MLNDLEAKALAAVIRAWSLTEAEQRSLLGPQTSGVSGHYEKRARDLIAIRKCMRFLIAEPRGLADTWMRNSNRAFGGRQPLHILIDEQGKGVDALKDYLHRFINAPE